ncbi:UNVERIFIED_CONTAM: hypothetical protein K2H54_038172 [Gekko kuhli]
MVENPPLLRPRDSNLILAKLVGATSFLSPLQSPTECRGDRAAGPGPSWLELSLVTSFPLETFLGQRSNQETKSTLSLHLAHLSGNKAKKSSYQKIKFSYFCFLSGQKGISSAIVKWDHFLCILVTCEEILSLTCCPHPLFSTNSPCLSGLCTVYNSKLTR